MRYSFCFLCYLVSVGFLLSLSAPVWAIGTTPPSWEPRETVVSSLAHFNATVGSDRALAYDHHGNPGIAFYDGPAADLRYARRVPGVGWVHSVIDSVGDVGRSPSLAYDRYERPAISYLEAVNEELKYAHFDGSAWQVEIADPFGDLGYYTSLAFDLFGRPAIAYLDADNTSLKYVADTDGDFSLAGETPVTVVNDFADGYFASLEFDPLNRPMIVHHDNTNFDLRFSVAEPGVGWVTTTVDSAGSTGWYPSMAIDPDSGHPAIAYTDATVSDLRYAAWDGDTWNLETVDSGGNVGAYPSLAFDPADGNPAISYHDGTNLDLKLAWHDGSAWQTQTVDAVGTVGLATSLAFDDYGTGFPSIAYLDGSSNLYFIEDPPAAVPEPSTLVLFVLGAVATLASYRRGLFFTEID